MKMIFNQFEFEKILEGSKSLICFIHSPWSMTSEFGKMKLKEIFRSNSSSNFIMIDNSSAKSFIYDWIQNKTLKTSVNIRIRGNGELFGIKNEKLDWFENSTFELENEYIIEKLKKTTR